MPGSPSVADLDQVRAAFRLGWAVSELRGRFRPDLFMNPVPGRRRSLGRPSHDLPLASERSTKEARIELLMAAQGLSVILGLSAQRNVARALARIVGLTWAINKVTEPEAESSSDWGILSDAFFTWDARVQDALVVQASQAAAYQLGRGLADTYWALDRDRQATEMGSWTCVLGVERREMLERLALRLSPFIGPQVLAAVVGPLGPWARLAADVSRRDVAAVVDDLYAQGLLWRDLVCGERLPSDLELRSVGAAWKDLSILKVVVSTLWLPLFAAGLGALALVGGAALLASGALGSGAGTAISVLGGVGITSASLYARAKADLTSIFGEIREALLLERVRRAADLCPPTPKLDAARSERMISRLGVRSRRLRDPRHR